MGQAIYILFLPKVKKIDDTIYNLIKTSLIKCYFVEKLMILFII